MNKSLKTGGKSVHCRYFKMKLLDSHKSDSINEMLQESIDEKDIVMSDKSTSYIDISDYV